MLLKIIVRINKFLVILFLISLVVVVSIQIFARVFLPSAPSWTEELARFLMIYLVALASGLAFKYNMFVNADMIFHIKGIHKNVIRTIKAVTQAIIFVSLLIMLIFSFPIIKVGFAQTSAALLLPMYIVFSTMVFMPLSILLVQFYNLITFLFKGGKYK